MKRYLLCLSVLAVALTGTVYAQAQVTLENFFQALEASPELEAAHASVRAAEANLAQAKNPAALDAGLASNAQADTPGDLSDTRLSVGVTAYPFFYGQQGDTVRLRELDLEQARLNLKLVRARLEATALENAADVQLSERSLALARTSAEAAEASYRTTELRFRRGVATARDVRDADTGQRQTQNLLQSAEANLELARATLRGLVGDVQLENLPKLPVPAGIPVNLQSADRTVAAARIGKDGATRPFLPVAELSYSYDASTQSRLEASISSSDLAPRLSYSFDNDGYGEGGNLSLSVSATLSPGQFDNVTRLDETLRAAEATRAAAERSSASDEGAIRNRLADAERSQALAALVLQNAERTLAEVSKREQLGVGNALETQAAAVELAQAGLDLRDARRDQLSALLDLYEFFGLPPSERLAAPRLETQP